MAQLPADHIPPALLPLFIVTYSMIVDLINYEKNFCCYFILTLFQLKFKFKKQK